MSKQGPENRPAKIIDNLSKHWRGYLGLLGSAGTTIAGLAAMRSPAVYDWLVRDVGVPSGVVTLGLEVPMNPEKLGIFNCRGRFSEAWFCEPITEETRNGRMKIGIREFGRDHNLETVRTSGYQSYDISSIGGRYDVKQTCEFMTTLRSDGTDDGTLVQGCLVEPPHKTPFWLLRASLAAIMSCFPNDPSVIYSQPKEEVSAMYLRPKIVTENGSIIPARIVIEKTTGEYGILED